MAEFFGIKSPAGDYVEKLIQLGATTPQGLERAAIQVQRFLAKQKPETMGRSEKREVIAVLDKFKEALTVLREEMYKCCLAGTTLEQMVQSVVKDQFGGGDSETKVLLKKRKEIEALMAADLAFEEEGAECATLKGGEIANCFTAIDEFKAVLGG